MASSSSLVRLPGAASVFGKYRLLAKLGQGGMADVFLAAHWDALGFEKLVVVKRLKAAIAADPDGIIMFLDEARIAARLNHPNLVQTHELGSTEDQHYIAMEYLEGQPLDRILHRLGYDNYLRIYLAILSDALAGLHHAHELCDYDGRPLTFVHRDVSPHNIFVTYDGHVKVVDFGISVWQQRTADKTHTGIVKGKIAYMSLEQAFSPNVDRRADLFAVGVILFEIGAGERFWGSLSDMQILQRMSLRDLPRLRERRPDAPESLIQLCERALSPNPEDRPATASDMRDEIERVLQAMGGRPSPQEIGKVVANAFDDRRVEVRTLIGDQIARLKELDGYLPDALPTLDDRSGPISIRGRSASQRDVLGVHTTPRTSEGPRGPEPASSLVPGYAANQAQTPLALPTPTDPPSLPVAPRGRSLRGTIILLGGALVGAAVAGSLVSLRSSIATPDTGVLPPSEPSSAILLTQQPALVELRINVTPHDATIVLDDVAVPSNPFVARFPRDGTGHRIRASAAGHRPDARLVVFDHDVDVTLHLEPKNEPEPTGGPGSQPVAEASYRAPRNARTTTPPAPPLDSRTPTSASSSKSTPASPPGLKVDSTDPWSRGKSP
ncbi:serine/threonine-protein kinase [Chondromyces crocatus]|uniref:serine/threonine-protein kinase n=1 Tax=Chondromyces crocatus TaxID=52 RepID=UPI001FDF7E8B|nr:serine/threonine-protein kinase [Chondromyces crocatus]